MPTKQGQLSLLLGCFRRGPLLEQQQGALSSQALMSSAVFLCVYAYRCVSGGEERSLLESSQISVTMYICIYIYKKKCVCVYNDVSDKTWCNPTLVHCFDLLHAILWIQITLVH